MWSTSVNPEKNLLQIAFSRRVGVEEAEACSRQVARLLSKVQPGFCLLTDLSGLEEMSLACEPVIDQVMDLLNQHGVQKVVRVVPEPEKDIGLGIMSLFHYGPRVRVVTCSSLDEAQGHLPPGPESGAPVPKESNQPG